MSTDQQLQEVLSVSASSRRFDRLETTFDHDGIVANAGLIVPATLMVRLGLEALIDTWVTTGSSRPGRRILTLVAAMIAGATHIDHFKHAPGGGDRAAVAVQADGWLNNRERSCGRSPLVTSGNSMLSGPASWPPDGPKVLVPVTGIW